MYLRSNHHRRGNYTTIANSSRSRSVYWFFHWFRRTRHQAGEDVLLPHPPTPVDPSVAPHRVLARLGESVILTRLDYCNGLLGGAPKCLRSPLSGVLRASCPTTDSVAPSNKQCSRSARTELHCLDIKSNFQVVRTRISMPPWVCSGLPCPLLYAGQCHRWTFISPICSIRSCYLYRERIPRQLALGLEHSWSHPRRLGTTFLSIFVIPVTAF